MLHITLLSGAEIAHVPLVELADVKALKQQLHAHHGLPPRFRQRLLYEGNLVIEYSTFSLWGFYNTMTPCSPNG